MKKIAKISFVAVLAMAGFTSNAMAADSIKEAFSKGKVKGSLKSYYFVQNFDNVSSNDSSIWVNGGSLNYITDSYNGLVLGTTFQASSVASIDDTAGKTKNTMDISGALLSEAYLAYTQSNTTIKAGRQFYSSPLVGGSGSRMIRESFEALFLTNTDFPNTTITVGHLAKYQKRSDGAGNVGKFNNISDDGVFTVYAQNNSIENLRIRAQYAGDKETADVIYLDAKFNMGDSYIAAQYYGTSYESSYSNDENAKFLGFKVGTKISELGLFAAYTTTGDSPTLRGFGQGPYDTFTSNTKTAGADAYKADTDSYQVGASYKFSDLQSKVRYSSYDVQAANSDLNEITINLEYKFSKEFKVQVDYSILDYEDNIKDATDFRTKLIYSF